MLSIDQLQIELRRALGLHIMEMDCALGEVTILVNRPRITEVLQILRDDEAIMMSQLVDVCAADYPQRPERFDVVYHLLSLQHNARVRVKLHTDERTPVPTVYKIFSTANWFEREVWDLMGITFDGHPDLRRILTDYGFEGHPLRKDFPLSGYVEVRYDETQKRVIYEPVKLPQDFRSFDFLSPWEGMTFERPVAPLPGDEKATTEVKP